MQDDTTPEVNKADPRNIHEYAEQLRQWALGAGAMDRELAGADLIDVNIAHPGKKVEAISTILHNRGINLIVVNDRDREITVYTHKAVIKKELPILAAAVGDESITVTYKTGSHASIKGTPPAPYGVFPDENFSGRYTCGSSVHVASPVGAGTMGCLVRDQAGVMYGLTNNHVSGLCSFAEDGLPILAPGPLDVQPGRTDPFTIGHHHNVLEMADGTPNNVDISKNSDAALFKISDPDLVSSMQRSSYDTPAKVITINGGMAVEKVGRTTGFTKGLVKGKVVGPEAVTYGYPSTRHIFFENLYVIEGLNASAPFSIQGDSGSLVTSVAPGGERYAVGIVVAAAGDLCYVLPIADILARFGVELVSQHNV